MAASLMLGEGQPGPWMDKITLGRAGLQMQVLRGRLWSNIL